MSASREKKQRQDVSATGLTEKQRRDMKEAQRANRNKILYTITGIIAVILVAALLVWNSGFFQKRTVAATVGDHSYTVGEVAYYYANARQQELQMAQIYQQFGMPFYDSTKSALEQIQDADSGATFDSYFKKQALEGLTQNTILCDQAKLANYTLSDEGKKAVDDSIANFKTTAAQYGMTTASYLKAVFGKHMSESTFRTVTTAAVLASEYQTHYQESLTYTEDDLTTYYKENAGTLDTFEYRFAQIDGAPEAKLDADGNAIDATDEEKAAAMADAKIKADEMAAALKGNADFNKTATQYVAETAKAAYADAEYNHVARSTGKDLANFSYGQWIADNTTARAAGDIGVVEDAAGSSYYVVKVLKRWLAEDTYATVDARHVLIKAAITETVVDPAATPAPESAAPATPTEEQYAAAKTRIEEIQAEWEAGDKTAESFGKLATLYTEDPGSKDKGGLYEKIAPDTMFAGFNDFIFAPDRKVGDIGIVQNTQTDQYGYHLIYIEGLGDLYWRGQTTDALRSADYTNWYDQLKFDYVSAPNEAGMNMLTA